MKIQAGPNVYDVFNALLKAHQTKRYSKTCNQSKIQTKELGGPATPTETHSRGAVSFVVQMFEFHRPENILHMETFKN